MSPILVVGSVAFDTLHNAQGSFPRVLGGSAVYASICASLLSQVRLVGVVGNDYPESATSMLSGRGIDLTGLEVAAGETFHWEGRYTDDLTSRSIAFEDRPLARASRSRPSRISVTIIAAASK